MELTFPIPLDDSGWPPVGAECVPCELSGSGYKILAAPLFVKGLSAGDVIRPDFRDDGYTVSNWEHLSRSDHSTVWVMVLPPNEQLIRNVLAQLNARGAATSLSLQLNCAAIDLPGHLSAVEFDAIVLPLSSADVPMAFPSWRHEEP